MGWGVFLAVVGGGTGHSGGYAGWEGETWNWPYVTEQSKSCLVGKFYAISAKKGGSSH